MVKRCVLMTALLLVSGPTSARADWLFTPNIGVGFGGDIASNDKLTYGASLGWMGAGILGLEADFAYTPQFFENGGDVDLFNKDNVTSLLGNIIIGVPIGGQSGGGVRPYVTGGVGWMKTHVESTGQFFTVNNDHFGFDLGGGLFIFATDHVGIRGDLRYYGDFQDFVSDNRIDITTGKLNFWRGTAGLTFRW